MVNNRNKLKNILLSIVGSMVGLMAFFLPISTTNGDTKNPLVMMIDFIKEILGDNINYVILAIMMLLCFTWIASRYSNNKALKDYHKGDGVVTGITFLLSAFFLILLVFNLAPEWLAHKDVGGLALYLGGSVFFTVLIAGFFVVFLTEFGFLEFLGTLLEPLMRPVYKLPGQAAVDAVTSFVAAPAVGIFLTDKLYKNGIYTEREAATIATSFSVCSLGFFALLASIGNIMEYLPHMIIVSFLINFILAALMARIPPLSNKKDVYFNGEMQMPADLKNTSNEPMFKLACTYAIEKVSNLKLATLLKSFKEVVVFAQKIVAYVVVIATAALVIATYTPVFDYLGLLVKPLIELMQLPDADKIAPTVLVSIAEIAMPAILIAGEEVSKMSVFFVCTLSTIQIIFFTESANAILESSIPLTILNLVVIFLLRTIIAIPFVALATHFIF